jgi:hypothetical protein
VTTWPSITRQYARFFGEFMVSLDFRALSNELHKSLILLARPTRFERVTFAFGGQQFCVGAALARARIKVKPRSKSSRTPSALRARPQSPRPARGHWLAGFPCGRAAVGRNDFSPEALIRPCHPSLQANRRREAG